MADSPTMRDLARALDLNVSTVSRALRNDIRVSQETREKCQRAAREMGYEADANYARAFAQLRVKRVHKEPTVLGLLTSYPSEAYWQRNPYYVRFISHIRARAAQLGYRIEPFSIKSPGISSRQLTTILCARGIPGLIVGPDLRGHLSMNLSHFATAMCCHGVWRPKLHRVEPYTYLNTLLAIRKLRRLGYRRIGFASFASNDHDVSHQSEAAYYYASATGIITEPIAIHLNTSGNPEFIAWVKECRPDAVLATHVDATLEGLATLGLRPGADIGVASVAGVMPGVSDYAGINNHSDKIDVAVVELVVDQINRNERGVPEHPRIVFVEGSWVDGPTVRVIRSREAGGISKVVHQR